MNVVERIDASDQKLLGSIAEEYADVFDAVRKIARCDMHAWFTAWEVMRRWEEEARSDTAGRDSGPASDAQLQELKKLGIATLSDLSCYEAALLLRSLRDHELADDAGRRRAS